MYSPFKKRMRFLCKNVHQRECVRECVRERELKCDVFIAMLNLFMKKIKSKIHKYKNY